MLFDDRGHLRYWAAVWRTVYGSDLASGTLGGKLAVIERVYRVAEELLSADRLDEVLATGDMNAVQPVLEAFFVRARNRALADGTNAAPEWDVARAFVSQIVGGVAGAGGSSSAPPTVTSPLPGSAATKLPAYISGMKAPHARRKQPTIRALPAEVVEDFLELLEPSATRNPFRSEDQRWRNYALFLLYLQLGLRRGEALILPAGAIQEDVSPHTGEVCLWINVDETVEEHEDSRHSHPRIKTAGSRRQIPVSSNVATVIEHYVFNFRGKQDHPFLFSSNQRRPLAQNTVNLIFEQASAALSPAAKRALLTRCHADSVSPHGLRHTCAVARLSAFVNSGIEMKLALQLLRSFFGWTPTSNMPQLYSRAMFEDRIRSFWQGKLDDRTEFLRQLAQLDARAGVHPGPDSVIQAIESNDGPEG